MEEELPQFRMCIRKFPQVGDLVYTEITRVTNTGADCILLEFDNLVAYLDINEWTRRRVKTVSKFTQVGLKFVMQVVRVDENRGYVDVARKNVTQEESDQHLALFKKSATLHNIFQRLSMISGLSMEVIYSQFGWPLYKTFAHPLDGLVEAARNQEVLQGEYQKLDALASPDGHPSQQLQKIVEHRFPIQITRVIGKIQLLSPGIEGIQLIKEILVEAKKQVGEKYSGPLEVTVEACPVYCITTKSNDARLSIEMVNAYIDTVKQLASGRRGVIFEIVEAGRVPL